jgi:hypothetical protein
MRNPQDLEEAFEAASRAITGYDLGKKADTEASLAEQVEALQIQFAKLTTGSRPSINCATPVSAPATNPFATYQLPVQAYQPPPRMEQGQIEYSTPVFYTPTTNAIPPLNRPYENQP